MRLTYADGVWTVPSQGGQGPYRVLFTPQGATCACEDWATRRQDCKHILACRLVAERDGGSTAPVMDTDAKPKRPTYKQDWPAYNEAQTTEKHRFQVLLAELCRGVRNPPPKGGRPPTPLADVVFACAFKVFSTFSSRRFGADLKEAYERGYLSKPMHPNKVNCHLENPGLTELLRQLVVRSSLPLRAVESVFAPDSTGFSASRFVRWFDEKYGKTRSGHDWVKAHAMCGVKTNIVTAVEILDREAGDSPQFKPLVETTAAHFTIKEVPADKAYLSNDNLELVESLGGTAFVPFKVNSTAGESGSLWEKMFHYYSLRREEFLTHYHRRSNAESTFAMLKAKFRDHVRSRTDDAMKNEVLCKFLCHNIVVVHQSQIELGIEAVFWPEQGAAAAAVPVILPLLR
jgi:transposase